jgi:hypothetical protein
MVLLETVPTASDTPIPLDERIEYRATEWERKGDGDAGRWTPSIHMPRWASRITLELTGVRVERVQDICGHGAALEGVQRESNYGCWPDDDYDAFVAEEDRLAVAAYRTLWDSLNAARGYGWDVNPWVWVLEFRRLEA